MNADASPGMAVELAFGAAPSSDIEALARTTLAIGAAALLGGWLLLYVGEQSGPVTATQKPSPPKPATWL